jgi:non-ribosomal peptide synthetase component F
MTLLTAFNVLLNYYSEQEDILVGSPSSHRDNLETERLIGYFVNILIMRADLSGDPTFKELLARTRETVLGAYTHKDLPFARLVDEISPHRSLSRNPLLQVVFGLNNVPIPNPQLSTLTLTELPIDSGTVQWDLILRMIESEDRLTASLQYSTNLYARSTAVRLLEHYEIVLNEIMTKPEARLKEIKAALAEADRRHRIAEEEKAEQASLLKLSNMMRRASKRSQTEGDYR